jgi:hypothetical protein
VRWVGRLMGGWWVGCCEASGRLLCGWWVGRFVEAGLAESRVETGVSGGWLEIGR